MITNTRISDEDFAQQRKEVLAMWKTGAEVDLDEAAEYHKSILATKNMAVKIDEARKHGEILLTSDMGHTTIEQEIELLQYIQNEGHTDLLGTMVDSFTRTNRFELAEREIEKSKASGKTLLNGFPLINHGVKGTRRVIDAVNLPVRLRFVGPVCRLIGEIGLAGGHTYTEAQTLICFMNYSKTNTFESVVREYQYLFRLIGEYERRGIPICAHPLGGNQIPGITPPSLILAGTILNLLSMPEQGVKHAWVNAAGQGNMAQDIAYAVVTPKLSNAYLKKIGYNDVTVYSGGAEIAGRYPRDEAQAIAEVLWSPIVSTFANVDVCLIKTHDEAQSITTKENAAYSLRSAKMMLRMLKEQKLNILGNEDIAVEMDILEKETRAIVDRALELGDGDPIVGAIKAIDAGILDHPVASNRHVKGVAMGARDARGAIRYLVCDNQPFSKEIRDFHKERLAEREKTIGKKLNWDMVVEDILQISQPLV
ncbi:MAG TPA: methylaspartate mutase subunit E [Syntrophorhabdaceae bacterium]|nr:methylaspartate mutase subunit E [Syntrophorhabdaceae bacterium]